MTDLEMTMICAEAMGRRVTRHPLNIDIKPPAIWTQNHHVDSAEGGGFYDPLHDDAQAMALVKRFSLAIQPPQFVRPPRWHVWRDENGSGDGEHTGIADVLNLNRAMLSALPRCKQQE